MLEWLKGQEKNPVWGAICWPISAMSFYIGHAYGIATFCAFFAGIAIEKLGKKLNKEDQ